MASLRSGLFSFAALLTLAHAFNLSPNPILDSSDAGSNTSEARPEEGDHVSALLQLDSWEHASALLEAHAQAEGAKHAQHAAPTELEGVFCDGADVAVLLDSSDTVLPKIDMMKALAKEIATQLLQRRPNSNMLVGTFGNGHEIKEFQGASVEAIHGFVDGVKPRRGWSDLKGVLPALAKGWGVAGRKKLLVLVSDGKLKDQQTLAASINDQIGDSYVVSAVNVDPEVAEVAAEDEAEEEEAAKNPTPTAAAASSDPHHRKQSLKLWHAYKMFQKSGDLDAAKIAREEFDEAYTRLRLRNRVRSMRGFARSERTLESKDGVASTAPAVLKEVLPAVFGERDPCTCIVGHGFEAPYTCTRFPGTRYVPSDCPGVGDHDPPTGWEFGAYIMNKEGDPTSIRGFAPLVIPYKVLFHSYEYGTGIYGATAMKKKLTGLLPGVEHIISYFAQTVCYASEDWRCGTSPAALIFQLREFDQEEVHYSEVSSYSEDVATGAYIHPPSNATGTVYEKEFPASLDSWTLLTFKFTPVAETSWLHIGAKPGTFGLYNFLLLKELGDVGCLDINSPGGKWPSFRFCNSYYNGQKAKEDCCRNSPSRDESDSGILPGWVQGPM